jgi:hypothetical protein
MNFFITLFLSANPWERELKNQVGINEPPCGKLGGYLRMILTQAFLFPLSKFSGQTGIIQPVNASTLTE